MPTADTFGGSRFFFRLENATLTEKILVRDPAFRRFPCIFLALEPDLNFDASGGTTISLNVMVGIFEKFVTQRVPLPNALGGEQRGMFELRVSTPFIPPRDGFDANLARVLHGQAPERP
jgi:hypothetical protein